MLQEKEFYAFISYKREDEKWAKWLQDKLEHYKFPTNLNGRTDLPKRIFPTFRDVTDMTPGLLAEEINKSLRNSEWLIIVCSPRSAKSPWVCKEAQIFIELGRADHIIPFVIEGNPFSNDTATECYPQALLNLTGSKELLAANINELGRDAAFIKVVARMFNLKFDTLWQRYEREKKRMRQIKMGIIITLLFLAIGVMGWIWHQNVLIKENEWKMMENQARAVAEKALSLVDEGDSYLARLLLLDVLPDPSSDIKRPYVIEAERALRKVLLYNNTIINDTSSFPIKVAFSPDGKRIAVAYLDETIKIYNLDIGLQIGQTLVGHNGRIESVLFSPDGNRVVSASLDRSIRIWDANTGEQIGKPLEGHLSGVASVSFNSDCEQIMSVSYDGTIRNWNTTTGKQIGIPLKFEVPKLESVAFGRDNKLIAMGSLDGKIRIIDSKTGEIVGSPLTGHTSWVNTVSYSPNYKMLVSTSLDWTIRFWDAITGQQIGEPINCNSESAFFSPDGKNIVSAGDNKMVKIWDVTTRQCVQMFKGHTTFAPDYAIYSPNGQRIVSVSRDQTRVWDINAPFFDKTILNFSLEEWNIRSWDSKTHHETQRTLPLKEELISGTFISPDGKWFLSKSYNSIYIWDASIIKCIKRIKGDFSNVSCVSFSPNAEHIVLGEESGIIRIIDITTGQDAKISDMHGDRVQSVSYSPDGMCIVSASRDSTIRIWNAKTGKPKGNPIVGHTNCVQSASFSSDGKRIVSTSLDKTIRIWDVETGKPIGNPIVGHTDWVQSAYFSPDGRHIVSASNDKTIRIFDALTGNQVGLPFKGHTKSVQSASFSSDGKLIVSTSFDKTIRIWDVASGQCLQVLESHDFINDAVFCSYNKIISSGYYDVTIWKYSPLKELIRKTRERFMNRKLTLEERRKYYLE